VPFGVTVHVTVGVNVSAAAEGPGVPFGVTVHVTVGATDERFNGRTDDVDVVGTTVSATDRVLASAVYASRTPSVAVSGTVGRPTTTVSGMHVFHVFPPAKPGRTGVHPALNTTRRTRRHILRDPLARWRP
jgi:hypothetical protein